MSRLSLSRSATAAGLLFALLSAQAGAATYSSVYSFGDSLSDTGNLYALTFALGGVATAQPQAGDYYQGRFSNGPVAVEYLATGLGATLHNYAYGGAMSNQLNGPAVAAGAPAVVQQTGVKAQLGMFSQSLGAGGHADASALYFVWAGPNDFKYQGYTPAVAQSTATNLITTVASLYSLGARDFFLPLLPDLGLTPSGIASGSAAQLSFLSQSFNSSLSAGYLQLASQLPGAHFTLFDTLAAQRSLVTNAAAYGITNTTTGCFTGYVGIAGTQCGNPQNYAFWDEVHPSAIAHQVLGAQMLAAVPEPQTVLMMAAGALLLLRRARQRQA